MQTQTHTNLFFVSLLAALFTIVVLLSACTPGSQEAPAADAPTTEEVTAAVPTATDAPAEETAPTEPPAPTAQTTGGNLTVRMTGSMARLRPWQPRSRSEEQVIDLMYSGLVSLDAELEPQPDLAEEWAFTPDGRTLTFTLRSDLQWHDGEPLDGTDVLFTLEQLRGLPITGTALLANLRYITGVSVPTSDTVVISLTERFAPLLSELALPILPEHILSGRDLETLNFWDVPVGSGPFLFASRVPGQSVVLARNEHYHKGAPLLDRVAFVNADEVDVTLEALAAGNLLLAEVPWEATGDLADFPDVRVESYPENGFYFLGFNLREGRPFADLLVRQALAEALNIPRLVEAATQGRGIPAGNSASPGSWADLTPSPLDEGDLELARELLNEAGWTLPEGGTIRQREGESFSATLYVRGDAPRRVQAAQRIADVAASIGLQIIVEPADFETVLISKYAPPYDYDLLLGSWLNGAGDPNFGDYRYYDPDDYALFHSSEIVRSELDTRNTRNFVGFSDPLYDEQAQTGRQIYDIEARSVAVQQAQERVAELLPYLYLWVDRMPVALHESVTTEDGPIDLESPRYFWNIERWYVR